MNREIFCVKLNQKAEGLEYVPFPGELGKKIYDSISETAWNMWLDHQTKIINEYRLNLSDDQARSDLESEMNYFLFGIEDNS